MKLASRYNRVNLVAALIVLLMTGLTYYQAISYILTRQLDQGLKVEEQEILSSIRQKGLIPESTKYDDQQIHYQKSTVPAVRTFRSRDFYNEHELEPGRELLTHVALNGKNYNISIILSRVESDELIQLIFWITILIALGTLLILFILNRIILGKLWQPFYSTLAEIKNFQLNKASGFEIQDSKIDEFRELNQAVQSMASRVSNEFSDLKVFTENASHELMTPIAVIRSKLDSLIQMESLSREQTEHLGDIYEAVSRMARINHSLLLLVKIENNLLGHTEQIAMDQLIMLKSRQFQELIANRGLQLRLSLVPVMLHMSQYLADILLNNLFTNSVNHNITGGDIEVLLETNKIVFSNPAHDGPLSDKIFGRFQKGAGSEGTGLGLTIVRQICLGLGWELSYSYAGKRHLFMISLLETAI